jgi:hypothetical protein
VKKIMTIAEKGTKAIPEPIKGVKRRKARME